MEALEFHLPVESNEGVSQFGLADRLLRLIRDRLQPVPVPEMPPKDIVLAAAGAAYDRYVGAFDLPFVPNLIEPLVDAHLRSMFLAAVDRLYDSLVAGS
jgi:hypothetical protein